MFTLSLNYNYLKQRELFFKVSNGLFLASISLTKLSFLNAWLKIFDELTGFLGFFRLGLTLGSGFGACWDRGLGTWTRA